MSTLEVFVRTLLKASAVFIGATTVMLYPSLDWSAGRSTAVTAGPAPRQAAVESLARALGDRDAAVRREAAAAITRIAQSRSTRELVVDLSDSDAGVRTRAACDLRELGTAATEAIQPLVGLLADATRVDGTACGRQRWHNGENVTTPGEQAAAALAAIGARAYDPLIAALRATAPVARRNAAWALGALDDSRAVAALVGALHDSDAEVRQQAAWALGAIGDRGGVEGLIGALKDENGRVREQAAWALGAIGDGAATDALIPLLKDPDVKVRRQAAWAIGAIGR